MSKLIKYSLVVLLLLGVGLSLLLYRPLDPNSFVMTGGTILTLDAENSTAEAVLVRDGKIAAVGRLFEIAKKSADLEIIDLDGATLVPGLIEPHTHPIASALLGATVDVSGFKFNDRQSIMTALAEAAGGIGLTPWVIAYGWDPLVVRDLTVPTLDELDAISPDKPLFVLTQMMHEGYANSAALKAAGLDITSKEQIIDGFPRDSSGKLTGVVREVAAIDRLIKHVPAAPAAATELLTRLQYIKYAKAGYTTIGVAGPVGRNADPVGLLKKISESPESPLRTFTYLLPNQTESWDLGGNANFKIKGVKFWMDGSPFTGGAAMEGNYENTELVTEKLGLPHNHTGSLNYNREEFKAIVLDYHKNGYQIAVHVQGERAVEEVLVAIEDAQTAFPNPDLRHRLEHNALITHKQLVRLKQLGMTAGFFVDHIYYYGDALPELMGAARMKRYMPLQTAIEAGLKITVHGDHPATPIDPFRTMKVAVDRLSVSGDTINGAAEKISRLDALRALTINGAIQLGEQEEIGSIEVGKRADFTILSENPLSLEASNFYKIEVIETLKDGRRSDTRLFSLPHVQLVWDILKEKISGGS
ncbi:MAG: amidohydrolase [Sneathiella sp.]